jgi:Ig-like domain CHU_C associated/Secretion system C-terminal sorting domain/Beta-propeller repeat
MMKLLLTLSLLLSIKFLSAQLPIFQWAKQVSGSGSNEFGNDIAVDSLGNVYTVGVFRGLADFDPGTSSFNLSSSGNFDGFILKTDANGVFVWAKKLGGTFDDYATKISIDNLGNLYVTGYFQGLVDFDLGSGTYNLAASSDPDSYILKLTKNGDFIWVKQFSGNLNISNSMAIDDSANIYTTGGFQGTVDFDPNVGVQNLNAVGLFDVFVSKLDSSGNLMWVKIIGSTSNDISQSIALDKQHNVYTTGMFTGTVDFDPGSGVFNLTSGYEDAFVSKLSSGGEFAWATRVGDVARELGYSITVDDSNNVYYAGVFEGTVDFDPSVTITNLTGVGSSDAFISKLDSLGKFVWATAIGGNSGDGAKDVASDAFGNVYLTGYYGNTADFDPSAAVANLTAVGLTDFFILKLTGAGNFVWAKSMGGSTSDAGNSIFLDAVNNIYTTGYFQGTVDFNPDAGVANLVSESGTLDIFTHKMMQCPTATAPVNTTSAANILICQGSSTTLSVSSSSSGTLGWYDAAIDGIYLGGNTSLVTENLFNTTTYYVQDSSCAGSSPRIAITVNIQLPSSNTIFASDCSTYTLNSQTYNASGTYTQHLSNANGCDSTLTLNLTILNPSLIVQNPSVCFGESFVVGSNTYTTTATYIDTLISISGCDSIITTHLTINDPIDVSTLTNESTITANQAGAQYQWIDCTNGNAPIIGETAQSFTANTNGNYAVIVNVLNCYDTSLCVGINGIGINENVLEKTTFIYPNPSSNIFHVVLHSKTEVIITSTLGELVYKKQLEKGTHQLNLENESVGLYIIQLNSTHINQVARLIKE